MHLPAPFERVGDHVGIALPGGRALFTTRRGGVSEGAYASLNLGRWTADDADAVDRNRNILAAAIGLPLEAVVQGRQVHGNRVERRAAPSGEPREADGVATAEPKLAPLVLTADCLPVALIAPGAVAMVHAGWRGLADGVVENGVAAVRELGGDGEVQAAIGPGAGGCCYEVGDDVAAAFGRSAGLLDLKAVARERLEAAGVAHVYDAGLCTICSDPDLFFSHRRDGGVTGRQAGVAWRS
ncbi:MAG: laccase domain-containing protein [Actinobacteria bacterium]|nr:laccase domain-containing protein [Actinomycetota bacterium]